MQEVVYDYIDTNQVTIKIVNKLSCILTQHHEIEKIRECDSWIKFTRRNMEKENKLWNTMLFNVSLEEKCVQKCDFCYFVVSLFKVLGIYNFLIVSCTTKAWKLCYPSNYVALEPK